MLTLVENTEEYREIARVCRTCITETCEDLRTEHQLKAVPISLGNLRYMLMAKDAKGTYHVYYYIAFMKYPQDQLKKPRQTRLLVHKLLSAAVKRRYKVENRQPLHELRYKFTTGRGKAIDLHVGILANDKRNSYYLISYDKDELAFTWTELKRKIQTYPKMLKQLKENRRIEELRKLYINKLSDKTYSKVPAISIWKECVDALYYHKEEQ